jgi:hypothetical protein
VWSTAYHEILHLPREYLYFFVAVYIPPQSEAGKKATLNDLYSTISKQENVHLEASLLVAGKFNAGKLKSVSPKNSGPPLLHT